MSKNIYLNPAQSLQYSGLQCSLSILFVGYIETKWQTDKCKRLSQ
uniref:Uncharacterized protein n=1 Tax=Anguilla anguilla TaxID=7936 RepID=A0A0E9VY56_ANGAN